MNRTKWLILCLVLCMATTLGGTIAYLTDSDGDVNVMTLGNVSIKLEELQRGDNGLEPFQDDKMMVPVVGRLNNAGDYGLPTNPGFIDKIVRVQCTSQHANAYLRVYIGIPSALEDSSGNDSQDALHKLPGSVIELPDDHDTSNWPWVLNAERSQDNVSIDGIKFHMYCFEYQKQLKPGEITQPVLAGLWLDSRLDTDSTDPNRYVMMLDGEAHPLDYDFSIGLQVPVLVQAVQADGFSSAEAAFTAAEMNNPDFDQLLELDIPVQLPYVLEELLNSLTCAFKAGDDRPINVETDMLPLAEPDFAAQLDALASEYPSTMMSIAPVAPAGVESITIELGKTSLPENISIIAPTGVNLIITGEEFD